MTTTAWTVTESFPDSAKRSFKAATVLRSAGDSETAAHMFGVAAECAVKAALEAAGIKVDRPSGLRHHFPTLRNAVLKHGQTRHMKRLTTCLAISPPVLNGYLIDTRYAADASIGAMLCAQWHQDAKNVFVACGISV